MKITFASWGNYTIAFKTLIQRLGFEVFPPEKTNPKVVEEGAKLSPELFCFPLKVNIGNYLPALRKGADTILMWENIGGSCRLRYYWIVQEKILREAGFKVKVLNFSSQNLLSRIKEIKKLNNLSLWQLLKTVHFFFKEISFIEKLEEKAHYFRPREKEKGQTEKVLRVALEKLDYNPPTTLKGLSKLEKETWQKFSKIEIDKNQKILKVGIVGEIYTVVDGEVNFGLDKKLGEMGIEVHRKLNLTQHLRGGFPPWNEWLLQRKVNPYLKSTVGGHGRQAIEEMLEYAKEGFDGVIHLLPFGCFVKDTNITVEGYLQKPIQEVKVGEKVLTHKGRFKKVTHKWCRNYQGPILKIDCGGKLNLLLTPEHPVLLAKRRKKRIHDFDFISAIDAQVGDSFVLPITPKITTVHIYEQPITDRELSHTSKINNPKEEVLHRFANEEIRITNRKKFIKHKKLEDYFLVPIRKIEIANFWGKVYTLTVEDDRSYVANFLTAKNCMPEVTVRPILQKISQENKLPFLSISLDEQTAEAGIQTRLEAFVDLMKSKKQNQLTI